jgi:predicted  nucleic acid-binding Zn-ribbon protein
MALVESLINEVQGMKNRCGMLERTVEQLQIARETHERTIESLRQHIVRLSHRLESLDLSYQGEVFEVAP